MDILTQLLDGEPGLAGHLFWGSIIIVALWEVVLPLRALAHSVVIRWLGNIGIAVINLVVMRVTIGYLTLDLAIAAEINGWGLLQLSPLPPWAMVMLGVLWLDFVSFATHWIMHQVPWLWRVHRLHHSDLDVDFTTARRHHPIEPLLMAPAMAVAGLGAVVPPASFFLWWGLTGVTSLFQHGNIAIPNRLDRVLRWFIATPAMHRVHHSAFRPETDSNYGQAFPWWDRLFGTYCDRPKADLKELRLGLEEFRETKELYLHRLLLQPFLAVKTARSTGANQN